MRNLKKLTFFLVILSLFFMVSCGSSSNDAKTDKDSVIQDKDTTEAIVEQDTVVQDKETQDEDVVKKPEYPKTGTDSKKIGDIACNFKFMAVNDKGEKEMELGDFYKSKKVIWLIFSTYDCPPCIQEGKDIPNINLPKYVKDGLQVIHIENGLLSGPQVNLEPTKLKEERAKEIEYFDNGENLKTVVYGYLKSQAGLYKYINKGYPVNVLIDASDMSIQKIWEGWDPNGIDDQKQLIEYLLGYYD